MDTNVEDQLDYEDEEYGGAQKLQYQGGGAIPALADDEMMGEDDDYDDLYSDVNVGESFLLVQRSEPQPVPPLGGGGTGNGVHQPPHVSVLQPKMEDVVSQGPSVPMVLSNFPPQFPEQKVGTSSGFQVSLPTLVKTEPDPTNMQVNLANEHTPFVNSGNGGGPTGVQIQPQQANQMRINVNMNPNVSHPIVTENQIRPSVDYGSTRVFVGELHWWTTDAEIETVLSHYGRVKEIKFFDEKASGKSKGYCQVDFFDPGAASECKEGMNGHLFNGRACVVAFASPQTLKQMGASYVNKNQVQSQIQPQGRRPMNDGVVGRGGGMNFQGGDGGRNFGRGGWGRGGQGMPNRAPGGGPPMRGRGGAVGARGFAGNNGGGVNTGGGFAGPGFAGPAGAMNMMHPQGMNMMGVGFDPTYMGRGGGGYGGFPGSGFPGMIPSFPGVNAMGLAGVAPHVNPAFFNRGMAPNGMGMMGPTGMEGHHPGMWTDATMGGVWGGGGEEHGQGQRTRESSYGGGEDGGGSDYGYGGGGGGEASHEKVARPNTATREKERGSEPERRHRDERENDRDRDRDRSDREHRYREERDGHRESRGRERDSGNDDDWDRGHSSRPRSRSRVISEDDHHKSRSRDADYSKRRRLPSE